MAVAVAHRTKSEVAFTAVRRMAERWDLSTGETARILGVSERTLRRMSDSPNRTLSPDVQERIANLIVIWEDLAAVFGRGPIADGWMRRPNTDFGGEPPVNRLSSGLLGDIIEVRRYLDLARQGW